MLGSFKGGEVLAAALARGGLTTVVVVLVVAVVVPAALGGFADAAALVALCDATAAAWLVSAWLAMPNTVQSQLPVPAMWTILDCAARVSRRY